ncbi:MAG: hypothetical protein RLZZ367_2228 [Bacteroidota bacterium]|jgi:hypothetical protein
MHSKSLPTLLVLFLCSLYVTAQVTAPEITSWIINVNNATGYSGLSANVQQVNYTTTDVYVTCTCIPGYDIGPWAGNPNTPANQNFCYKITRTPAEKTGTKTATSLGHIGVWTNGVSIFNAKDAFSYNNGGVWNQDAYPNEGSSFDDCLGHPAPNGEYHHHVNPRCLYDDQASTVHSPIIGYAFDGFPVYGAYAYANTDGTGGITRMKTGYRLRSITDRTTLADGTVLQSSQYGPAINAQYPLGKYLEDYEYIQGLGHLDQYNGRFCITPEYPNGTYAYFVTIDSNQMPVYPYTVGPNYYGVVPAGSVGPQSGHNTIPGTATLYTPETTTGITEQTQPQLSVYPNPAHGQLTIAGSGTLEQVKLIDMMGREVLYTSKTTTNNLSIDVSVLSAGVYTLYATTGKQTLTQKVIIN